MRANLLLYVLFDGNFASALIDLGFSDAAQIEDEMAEMFLARHRARTESAPAAAVGSGAAD